MWLIAGVILGSLMFVSAFVFLSNYTRNIEISQADESFESLNQVIQRVCMGGPYSQEIESFVFPYITDRIFVQDQNKILGNGTELCMQVSELPLDCHEIRRCSLSMNTLDFEKTSGVFFFIQRGLGKKKPAKIKFKVSKIDTNTLNVSWQREVS